MNATIATMGKGKGVTLATSCLIGLLSLVSASAAPLFDDGLVPYPATWSIFREGGSGLFVNGSLPGEPTLTVTTEATNPNAVIFSWNPTNTPPPVSYSGAGSNGASLIAADNQYVLVLNGVTPVVPDGGTAVPLLLLPLFGTTPGDLDGYGGGYITVTPDANGTISFDMLAFAESIYAPENMPTIWSMQLYIPRPEGAYYDVGYSFESFAAVGIPEPSTVAIVTMAGLALVVFFRKRIRLAA